MLALLTVKSETGACFLVEVNGSCSESIVYHIYQHCVKHRVATACVYVCVHVSLFTGLLSRSACGVEHPLTLSCAQRNDSAWYTSLGNGEEKTKARA